MITGVDQNGNLRNVKVSEAGELLVKMGSGSGEGESKETTLYSNIMNLNTEEQTIGVNKKVTEISIANYSETANVLLSVDEENYVVAPNMAVDLPINKSVGIIGLSSTEADTKVQYIIKGEE